MQKTKSKKNKKQVKKSSKYLTIYILAIFIVLLSLINIHGYLFPKETNVLGIEATNTEGIYWYDFLQKNPNYIPGWLEIGRPDKSRAIDPNYF